MFELLVDSYTPWAEIVDDENSTFSGPRADDELIHSAGRHNILGFDYTAAVGSEREYVFSVARWIALKVGRRRRRFRGLALNSPVPYWLPDGTEPHPVLLAEEWPDLPPDGPRVCSPYGVFVGYRTLRELSWYHIPDGAHERISATHHGRDTDDIKEALIEAGWEGAKSTLKLIEAHIARLDTLWAEP